MSETENNSQLPKPLVLENVDLRDFEYMPLDVVRFRDSDFTDPRQNNGHVVPLKLT